MKVIVEVVKAELGKAWYRISTYSNKYSITIYSDYKLFNLVLDKHNHILSYSDVVKCLH